ncbi:HlyD family efflux transporter periplasmic adaptor subunit [Virgibacillus siamensis]|uniref:HlyD family efflux transporter periplasmic adaptor subunit n=1 Tax=Virgibacillus siamensis TaxID=480071 RepID=UPI000987B191|nr:HlyD family efflux transporter periplasmic adaptor subunit [Virgibacillus siamensis]
MNRRKVILTLIVLFFGVNCLLVYLDEDEKVDRFSYIDEWAAITKQDMYETIETDGVLQAAKENSVYFDEDKGSFLEFKVEDGAEVDVGDALFTYEPRNFYETKAQLESDAASLNGQIAAIEEAIARVSSFQAPQSDLEAQFEGESAKFDLTHEPVEVEYMKEAYIAEQKKELAQKKAELDSIQGQLSDLESSGDTITVESAYQGRVAKLSETLENPVVMIRGMELEAAGKLTEEERMEVEPEMPVKVNIRENSDMLKGTLSAISDTPQTVNVHTASVYPFQVKFEDGTNTEKLLPGYHAKLAITTKASQNAAVVRENQLFGTNVWMLTDQGLLQRQKVQTGINMGDLIEIKKGADTGEWAAQGDWDQFRNGTPFITSLDITDIQWKRIGKYDNVSWKEYFVTGLLNR